MDLLTYTKLLEPIQQFLQAPTPEAWLMEANKAENLPLLLIDHMICELKAAQTAAWLLRKYAVDQESGQRLLNWLAPYEDVIYNKVGESLSLLQLNNEITKKLTLKQDCPYSEELVDSMILLIKEELHHFSQVLTIMQQRGIPYQNITAGRYAKKLLQQVRTHEPATLIDRLVLGAYIEARSCERFAKLAPYLDDELKAFYISLLRSEARHYQDYLKLAEKIAQQDISSRIQEIGRVEAELITTPDNELRFHSGIPSY